MIKPLLLATLLALHLSAYEIVIDKTLQAPKMEKVEKKSTLTRDNSKEIVHDSATGLMWQDDSAAKSVQKDWEDAKAYCQNLTHGGYNDWYLPTISELESLADYSKVNPAIKEGFKNVASSVYWSSSPYVSDSQYAWYVYFNFGNSGYYDKTNEFYVRCARAGQ